MTTHEGADNVNDLSEVAFTVLRTAVNIAKDNQVQTVSSLRLHLERLYPDRNDEINAALKYWGRYISISSGGR